MCDNLPHHGAGPPPLLAQILLCASRGELYARSFWSGRREIGSYPTLSAVVMFGDRSTTLARKAIGKSPNCRRSRPMDAPLNFSPERGSRKPPSYCPAPADLPPPQRTQRGAQANRAEGCNRPERSCGMLSHMSIPHRSLLAKAVRRAYEHTASSWPTRASSPPHRPGLRMLRRDEFHRGSSVTVPSIRRGRRGAPSALDRAAPCALPRRMRSHLTFTRRGIP